MNAIAAALADLLETYRSDLRNFDTSGADEVRSILARIGLTGCEGPALMWDRWTGRRVRV